MSPRPLAATLALLLLAAAPAFAEGDRDTPPPHKSERLATGLSIGGTLAGPAMILIANRIAEKSWNDNGPDALGVAGGLFVLAGPSIGHWYAGRVLTLGLGLRAIGMASLGGGVMANYSCFPEDTTCGHKLVPVIAMVAGGASLLTGTVLDIVTAHREVRGWNARHQAVLAPVPMGRGGAGLSFAGRF